MKQLAKNSLKKMLIVVITTCFLISSLFSLRYKQRAQSDFAKETLSFLLLEKNEPNFKDTLEKLNNSLSDYSIIYIAKDGTVLSNEYMVKIDFMDKMDYKENKISKKTLSDGFPMFKTIYRVGDDDNIFLAYNHSLSFYINPVLLIIYILILIISIVIADRKTEKDINSYLEGLRLDYVNNNLNESQYIEFRPYILAYNNKINQLKRDNKSLADRLSELTNMTSNMKEGLILFDSKGEIELINKSAQKYLSVNKDVNINNLIESKEYKLALREASILKRSKYFDLEINDYHLRIFIDPLSNTSKSSFAIIIIDNSEDKQAEKMRREFTANVTHELKSPLTSINGYAELISTGIAKEDDVRKFADIIYIEGNRLLEIIDDILKLSRLDEQNFEKDFSEIDVYEVVRSTIEKYKNLSDRKNIKVINETRHYRIKTSKSLFYDLVSNIYENAIKYNKLGGEIIVSADFGENNYYLKISDTGVGIGQKDIDRIFERFYVADKSRKRNQKSTGLGLSIVKHIANYLGYEIKVKSKLDEGTTFSIIIPIKIDN